MILMEDGIQYVPLEAIEYDLKKDGFRFMTMYDNIYKRVYKESLKKMHQYVKQFQTLESCDFERRFPQSIVPKKKKVNEPMRMTLRSHKKKLELS